MKYKEKMKCRECDKEIWKKGNRKYCKECAIIISKKRNTSKRRKEYQKQWRKNNPEKFKKIRERTYLKYREKIISHQKERYNKHKLELSEYCHNRYESRKAQGICVQCKNPLSIECKNKKSVICSACVQKNSERRRKLQKKRQEHFLCVYCGKPAIARIKNCVCEECWLKAISLANTGSKKNWLSLKELLQKQNYKCAYSGKKLIIGKGASIDHIIPKVNGGDNSIENLQWIDLRINKMKSNISHSEFISIIKLIYKKIFIEK